MRTLILVTAFLPSLALAEPNPQIERAWKAKCSSCHGPDGKGQTEQGKKMLVSDMSSAAWQSKFTDDQIKTAIGEGLKREKNGVMQAMEAYKTKLHPDQIDGLVAYIRSLKK